MGTSTNMNIVSAKMLLLTRKTRLPQSMAGAGMCIQSTSGTEGILEYKKSLGAKKVS